MTDPARGTAIGSLPEELIEMILLRAAQLETDEFEFSAGGRLVAWDDYNHAFRLALVCKQWLRPAQSVLYRSISLRGLRQPTLFARTAHARPDLASRVRWLSLGLGDALEMSVRACGQAEASLALMEAAELCVDVAHLHFRPMGAAARPRLKGLVAERPLRSLVVAPRVADPLGMKWYHGLANHADFVVPNVTALENCEFDMYVPPAPNPGLVIQETSAFTYPPLRVRVLRYDSDMPTPRILKFIKAAGPSLEVLDVYHEQPVDVDEAYEALLPAAKTLVRLRWRMNPGVSPSASSDGSRSPSPAPLVPATNPPTTALTVDTSRLPRPTGSTTPSPLSASSAPSVDTRPLFDRLLPHFERLERLYASSDCITPTLIDVQLPSRLRHIEIQAFEGEGLRRPADQVAALAQAPAVAGGARDVSLTLVGNRTLWEDKELTEFGRLMGERGVRFRYRDAAEDDDDGTDDGGSVRSEDCRGGR